MIITFCAVVSTVVLCGIWRTLRQIQKAQRGDQIADMLDRKRPRLDPVPDAAPRQ